MKKVRRTPPQGRLTARERRTNLRGAFALLRYGRERVLLVDDIGTTGSTVEECARTLKRGGCESVGCGSASLALARFGGLGVGW